MGSTITIETQRDAKELVREEVTFTSDEHTNVEYIGGRSVAVTGADSAVWYSSEFESIHDSPWWVSGLVEGGVVLTRE